MKPPLTICSDLSEEVRYNVPDLKLYIKKDFLSRYGYAAACHWHPDLEFICVLDGSMDFYINGEILHLNSSQGVFVNSSRLHYGFSTQKKECTFLAIVIHPTVLHQDKPFLRLHFDEKFNTATEDFILLREEIPWQKEIMEFMKKLHTEMISPNRSVLNLLAYALLMDAKISENIQKKTAVQKEDRLADPAMWKMVAFIHQNYMNNIKIDEIAKAANICRSNCCKLFRKSIMESPTAYLRHYRIMKSCQMLLDTNRSISEIADACGFQSVSYFIMVFKKEMGMSPAKYRNQKIL